MVRIDRKHLLLECNAAFINFAGGNVKPNSQSLGLPDFGNLFFAIAPFLSNFIEIGKSTLTVCDE